MHISFTPFGLTGVTFKREGGFLMSFTESLQSVFQNYAVFEGRARRSEYWWFCLAYSLVSSVISGVARAVGSGGASMALSSISAIIAVACLVPSIAVTTRRLHDTGRS